MGTTKKLKRRGGRVTIAWRLAHVPTAQINAARDKPKPLICNYGVYHTMAVYLIHILGNVTALDTNRRQDCV